MNHSEEIIEILNRFGFQTDTGINSIFRGTKPRTYIYNVELGYILILTFHNDDTEFRLERYDLDDYYQFSISYHSNSTMGKKKLKLDEFLKEHI